MKNWMFRLCWLFGLVVIVIIISFINIHKHSWEISNLEMQSNSEVWKKLNFDEAVHLDLELCESGNYPIVEENLKKLANEIIKKTGNEILYYQFIGSFSIKGDEQVRGILSTLVLVVNDDIPYIYTVRNPMTKVWCERGDITWTHLSSYNVVDTNGVTVRLGAAGYISMAMKNERHPEQLSNTLYPTYIVSIP